MHVIKIFVSLKYVFEMITLCFSIFLLIFDNVSAVDNCPIKFCNGTGPTHSDVEHMCKNVKNDTHMIDRCCISNETGAVVGLDLSSCQIQHINISESNLTDLVILDLRDNDLKNLASSDLTGLVNLNYLWLPYWINCPGGDKAWNTTESNTTFCYFQENPCKYLNISCTINGLCIHVGPGSAKCVCKPGHYGYKCMNEGHFPVTTFSISLTVITVVLSIVLWFAYGRDAYRKR